MAGDRRWTERDRFGNEIYITQERWEHVIDSHPEMEGCERELRETIRFGQRRQDALNPQKFRYSSGFSNLPYGNTHVVAIVLLRFDGDSEGRPAPNNYIVTAFQKSAR